MASQSTNERVPSSLTSEDDRAHIPGPKEMWRESSYMTLYDPSKAIFASLWMGVRPTLNQGEVKFVVWGGNDVIYHFENWGGLEFTHNPGESHLEAGPATFKSIKPFQTCQFQFNSQQCQMEVEWKATSSAYDLGWETITESKRIEQSGKISGNLSIDGCFDGKYIPIRGFSGRDKAWGVRDHSNFGHWIGMSPQFTKNFSASIGCLSYQNSNYKYGYLKKEGRQSELTRIELSTNYQNVGGPPETANLYLEDDLGRNQMIEVEPQGVYPGAFGDSGDMGIIYLGQAKFLADEKIGYGFCDYVWTDIGLYDQGLIILDENAGFPKPG